jgi:hypothetical protein
MVGAGVSRPREEGGVVRKKEQQNDINPSVLTEGRRSSEKEKNKKIIWKDY